jgi:hypothetical protein
MASQSGFVELGGPNDGLRAAPIVCETYWGYVIRPAEPFLERAAIIEIAATFAGVLMFCAAYGHWLLPGSDFSAMMIPVKIVSTLIFAAFGATLFWVGRQGMVQEMHVDRVKSEIRLVQRNRHGEGRVIAMFRFQEVASVVLRRSKSPFSPTRLALRMARSGGMVDILPSDENELLPIRDRLIVDMSPRFRGPPQVRQVRVSEAA